MHTASSRVENSVQVSFCQLNWLGWNSLPGTNALAYFAAASGTKEKSSIKLKPGWQFCEDCVTFDGGSSDSPKKIKHQIVIMILYDTVTAERRSLCTSKRKWRCCFVTI